MAEPLPTWYKEAVRGGINYIVLIYEKAEGFAFCPTNLEYPFRVGGDYDGNFPVSAGGALAHYHGYFSEYFKDRVEWFIPFVEKVQRNEDFSLLELDISARELNVIQGQWPW